MMCYSHYCCYCLNRVTLNNIKCCLNRVRIKGNIVINASSLSASLDQDNVSIINLNIKLIILCLNQYSLYIMIDICIIYYMCLLDID